MKIILKELLPILFSAILHFSCSAPVKEEYSEGTKMETSETTETVQEIYSNPILEKNILKKINLFLKSASKKNSQIKIPPGTKVKKLIVNDKQKKLIIELNNAFAGMPYRENMIKEISKQFEIAVGDEYSDFEIVIKSLDVPIYELIPNIYRSSKAKVDKSRLSTRKNAFNVVHNLSKNYRPTNGLADRNIGLWHSHGWYYNNITERWEWQRARLFQSVEDLIPLSFMLPYIIPMLENAGANVFVARERDTQINRVMVDNDNPIEFENNEHYKEWEKSEAFMWSPGGSEAFAIGDGTYPDSLNPFSEGSHRINVTSEDEKAYVEWIPEIPESGEYAVYVSYVSSSENTSDARYFVHHAGGITEFSVNQTVGGGTWIYLGTFFFKKGFNSDSAKVHLSNISNDKNKILSADAVRFGGGMGVIERGGSTSGRPLYTEGSRYYLQFAGMPRNTVYSMSNGNDDYKDDYQSRGEFLNYLTGKPAGPNLNRKSKGLGIPIDLSFAFHTDAGITLGDTSIGTLVIYSIDDYEDKNVFPDKVSRFANRDLSDILQTQIVEDIKAKYDSGWTRRDLRNADYSEAVRPNMPSTLLELFSHQNFYEMKFFHDPKFRFDVSRSIYKAFLKFISFQNGYNYVVQPLPVDNFSAFLDKDTSITLNWQPVFDPLEESAVPDSYIVYTRIDSGGFDNGKIVNTNQFKLKNFSKGKIYSFKVSALNNGGESLPSEILSVYDHPESKDTVLVINGFDRVSAPAVISFPGFEGFADFIDEGVPDKYTVSYTGSQYDFDRNSLFITNDAPGHGASFANYEVSKIAGNNFDYPYLHGRSIKSSGFSFVSTSDEAVMNNFIDLQLYDIIDLILGEEKSTPVVNNKKNEILYDTFPELLIGKITPYLESGGNLFVSGAYVASDSTSSGSNPYLKSNFISEYLKIKFVTNFGSKTGKVDYSSEDLGELEFNTEFCDKIYKVEAPDAIDPINDSKTILRYRDNQFSAGISYEGIYKIIVTGFPFESIKRTSDRNFLMKNILDFFTKDKEK